MLFCVTWYLDNSWTGIYLLQLSQGMEFGLVLLNLGKVSAKLGKYFSNEKKTFSKYVFLNQENDLKILI